MDWNWVKFLSLICIALGFFIGIYGLKKRSLLTVLSGVTFLLIPIFLSLGWYFFILFFPPLVFIFSNNDSKKR
ncbi:hypothetical protein [Ureibacillus terrenus]|uniref:hypothetical protein n=1 Tax=Ureibacillus terrenus TaxID=118246 RepID=UPI002E214AD5|nr:hypothetical protein [Ureibacillus terrenus]